MIEKKNNKLIHLACIQEKGKGNILLFLREVQPLKYQWFKEDAPNQEVATSICTDNLEEALRLAPQFWKNNSFRTIICGFRYSLPERDEHGVNALFHQMAASYASSTGVYFEEELGHNCIVHFASREARDLLKTLQLQGRL